MKKKIGERGDVQCTHGLFSKKGYLSIPAEELHLHTFYVYWILNDIHFIFVFLHKKIEMKKKISKQEVFGKIT